MNPTVSLAEHVFPGARLFAGCAYVENGVPKQRLDLYLPPGPGPFPVVAWIHGGGWHSGDKQPEGERFARTFVDEGIALAAIAYRLTPAAPFPAQIEDCDAALAWLRKHASSLGLDARRVGLFGHSAGAHLCALMAVSGGRGTCVNDGAAVQAAVCWSPPCDLDRVRGEWPETTFPWNPKDPFCRTFFPGGSYDTEVARAASPASHVHGDAPPMLVVHGLQDSVVPAGQAIRFVEALRGAGARASFRGEEVKGHDVIEDALVAEAARFFKAELWTGGTD